MFYDHRHRALPKHSWIWTSKSNFARARSLSHLNTMMATPYRETNTGHPRNSAHRKPDFETPFAPRCNHIDPRVFLLQYEPPQIPTRTHRNPRGPKTHSCSHQKLLSNNGRSQLSICLALCFSRVEHKWSQQIFGPPLFSVLILLWCDN